MNGLRCGRRPALVNTSLADRLRVTPDLDLDSVRPDETFGMDEPQAAEALEANSRRIAELQNVLYAEKKQALLVVLQAMDTGGKDPIIRDVLSAANPQACRVTAFKKPAGQEKRHDHFWRFHQHVPAMGEIGVFNRSYYDEVIATTAHGDMPPDRLRAMLEQANAFESILSGNNVQVVKLYLHMSKEEQKRRLRERLDDPTRHWELSPSDFEEREHWDGYMHAYQTVLRGSCCAEAPWFLIPSDRKWFRDYAASQIVVETLESMRPEFPPASFDLSTVKLD